MSLPEFNEFGDLPEGVHTASLTELVGRFGTGSIESEAVTARLHRIYELAMSTGALDRLIVFGSSVSNKLAPNNVDVILMMWGDFHPNISSPEALVLFDHRRATSELGASVFWIRPGMLLGESLNEFISHWQVKRDGSKRGIVEVST